MTLAGEIFPFGGPMTRCPPGGHGNDAKLVLSTSAAAHWVCWTRLDASAENDSVDDFQIPIAVEPVAGWDGSGNEAFATSWAARIGFRAPWGRVRSGPVSRFQQWFAQHVLWPREELTDYASPRLTYCLPTYFLDHETYARLRRTYDPRRKSLDLPEWSLRVRPPDDVLVEEVLATEADRLRAEIERGRTDEIITLGEVPLRVLRRLLGEAVPERLPSNPAAYGERRSVRLGRRYLSLVALEDPALIARRWTAHKAWMERRLAEWREPLPACPGCDSRWSDQLVEVPDALKLSQPIGFKRDFRRTSSSPDYQCRRCGVAFTRSDSEARVIRAQPSD